MFEKILFISNDTKRRNDFYDVFSFQGDKVITNPEVDEPLDLLKTHRPKYIVLDQDHITFDAVRFKKEVQNIDDGIIVIDVPEGDRAFLGVREFLREHVAVAMSGQSSEQERAQSGRRVLIVDDEKEAVALLEKFFHKKGYEVFTAFNGEEALLKVKIEKPQAVLLDINMVGMDGLVVLKRIKENDPSVVVIMTSAYEGEEIIREAKELGADEYMVKPFNLKLLEKTIFNSLKEVKMEIIVKKPTPDELDVLGVQEWAPWECEVSTFDWTYTDKETAYLKQGKVRVKTENTEVSFGAGDLVIFPKGLACTWFVEKPVKKVYKFG
ncbi:MAG: response regulator [Candidatus Omnitrophota bacterium]